MYYGASGIWCQPFKTSLSRQLFTHATTQTVEVRNSSTNQNHVFIVRRGVFDPTPEGIIHLGHTFISTPGGASTTFTAPTDKPIILALFAPAKPHLVTCILTLGPGTGPFVRYDINTETLRQCIHPNNFNYALTW